MLPGPPRRSEVVVEPPGHLVRPLDVVAPQRRGEERDMPVAEIPGIRLTVLDEPALLVDPCAVCVAGAIAVHEVVEILVPAGLPIMIRRGDPVQAALRLTPHGFPVVDVVLAGGNVVLKVAQTEEGV